MFECYSDIFISFFLGLINYCLEIILFEIRLGKMFGVFKCYLNDGSFGELVYIYNVIGLLYGDLE